MSFIFGFGLLKLIAGAAGAGALGLISHLTGAHTKVVAAAKRVPKKAWLIIAGIVALGALVWLHQHIAHKALAAEYARGRADEKVIDDKTAAEADKLMGDVVVPISEKARTNNETQLGVIHAAADALRVRGAGKAECRDPALSPGAGEHGTGDQPGDAAIPELPQPERGALIAMPVSSAIGFAEDHDAILTEVKTWHGWYNNIYAAWEKQREDAAKPH